MRANSQRAYNAAVLKRAGEAAHGLRDSLPEGEVGVVFVNLEDVTDVQIGLTEEKIQELKDTVGQEPEKWVDVWFKGEAKTNPGDARIRVTLGRPGGEPYVFSANADPSDPGAPWVDTVFLSLSAIDKFAIPYYAALYGPEVAMSIRQKFIDSGAEALLHDPGTVYEYVDLPELHGFTMSSISSLLGQSFE